MSQRISKVKVQLMVSTLDGWPNDRKLTWDSFISECQSSLHFRYSRQSLCKHWQIAEAFMRTKKRLKENTRNYTVQGLTLQKAGERIRRLENENESLRNANSALLEQFVKWAYNAANRGLTEKYLNQPLPVADRNPSVSSQR